jgi:hypothetical protein
LQCYYDNESTSSRFYNHFTEGVSLWPIIDEKKRIGYHSNARYQHFFQRKRKDYEDGKACDERDECGQGHGWKAQANLKKTSTWKSIPAQKRRSVLFGKSQIS